MSVSNGTSGVAVAVQPPEAAVLTNAAPPGFESCWLMAFSTHVPLESSTTANRAPIGMNSSPPNSIASYGFGCDTTTDWSGGLLSSGRGGLPVTG